LSRKIREFGETPYDKLEGDEYHCEICRKKGDLGYELLQCPYCGRWICDDCWEESDAMCKVCFKLGHSTDLDSTFSKMDQFEERLTRIENYITNLNEKLGSFKFCPFCNAPMPKKAKYCGICGKEFREATAAITSPPMTTFNLKVLAQRLEKVFPTMVKLYEHQGFIMVMDKVKVTEKGVVAGSGPAADRVQKVYEEYINECRNNPKI